MNNIGSLMLHPNWDVSTLIFECAPSGLFSARLFMDGVIVATCNCDTLEESMDQLEELAGPILRNLEE